MSEPVRDADAVRSARSEIASFYSRSAEGYERLWAPELLPLSRSLVERLQIEEARRVLEVGAGVGALLAELERLAPRAVVTGTDLAHGMLERAPSRLPRAVMDAAALGFADSAFDIVIAAFVLFHLPDPGAGIAEIARVLRAGGRVGTATWGEEREPVACQIWLEELERHGSPPPDPNFAKFEYVDTPEKVQALMEKSGLEVVSFWKGIYRAAWTPDEFLAHRTGHGRSRARFEALSREVREACLKRARSRLQELSPPDLEERSEVVYVIGQS